MNAVQMLEKFRADRPDLGPDAKPAVHDNPYGPDEPITCSCGNWLSEDECQPDWSYEGPEDGGWCGSNGQCVVCDAEEQAEAAAARQDGK